MLGMAPKSRCTTATSPELGVGKYLPTRLTESLGRTILDIGTLLKTLPDCRPLCFCPGKVAKFITIFGRIKDLAPPRIPILDRISFPESMSLVGRQVQVFKRITFLGVFDFNGWRRRVWDYAASEWIRELRQRAIT
jgi:hypothetical protein